jgi:hypothetical protein
MYYAVFFHCSRYLTPIILDHARQLRCLRTLNGDATIKVVSEGKWQLYFPRLDVSDPLIRHCLTAAVGDFLWVHPHFEPSKTCVFFLLLHITVNLIFLGNQKRLIVKGTSEGHLELEQGIGGDQRVPSFLQKPKQKITHLDCVVEFEPCDLIDKMQISSTVDLFTALGDRFMGVTETSMPTIGVPLVNIVLFASFFLFIVIELRLLLNLIEVFAIIC